MLTDFRFRADGEMLVLQVQEEGKWDRFNSERTLSWRDAKVEDMLWVAALIRNQNAAQISSAIDRLTCA